MGERGSEVVELGLDVRNLIPSLSHSLTSFRAPCDGQKPSLEIFLNLPVRVVTRFPE